MKTYLLKTKNTYIILVSDTVVKLRKL